MNEFDELAPGETEREKSEKSRNFVKEIIGIYTSDPNRTPARALSILEGIVHNPNIIPYPYLYHISQLNPEDTRICLALIHPENMPHMIGLIYEILISHQNGEKIMKQPILKKINTESK